MKLVTPMHLAASADCQMARASTWTLGYHGLPGGVIQHGWKPWTIEIGDVPIWPPQENGGCGTLPCKGLPEGIPSETWNTGELEEHDIDGGLDSQRFGVVHTSWHHRRPVSLKDTQSLMVMGPVPAMQRCRYLCLMSVPIGSYNLEAWPIHVHQNLSM